MSVQQGFINMPEGHPALMDGRQGPAFTAKSDDAADPEAEKKRKRSTQVLSSEEQSSQSDRFCAYYCFACGSFAMAVEGLLHTMPRRKADASTVLPKKASLKHSFKKGECKSIKREGGTEKQFRWNCGSCAVPICYQSKPFDHEEIDYMYIFDCALAMNPSVVSLYWKDGQSKHTPKCFHLDGKVASVPIKISIEGKRFEVKNIGDSVYVTVRASGVGGDMKQANAEALRILAKVIGVSLKQVRISTGSLQVTDCPIRDIFRRLICAMF
mmetsp:Transcript_27109/g.64683  ORF Transcript_27109/g.64683 Transcript_27109/m.64683 type:complete len:269 (+) Transcript_27109:36-842(+)|eukprot:CAMPEP_0180156668 /NCGR_PEP_ID=MMETSP0986-20121125/25723_1 /TAXON_ID=697907 /ORGANISM="non described non described, Strain CCMP2293" /LENGTH=268 /DNA_ID=CAMNT_0022105921 /DNA_START=35 /DNA_END=841 /DNA_ORIENTATION=+